MTGPLTYAPTPPLDRVHVVWQGHEFELTIPARYTLRGFCVLLGQSAIAVIFGIIALNPQSDLHGLIRAGFAFPGFLCGWAAVTTIRRARTWATLTLRKGRMEVAVPALFGWTIRRYLFSTFKEAVVDRPRSRRQHGRWLVLRRYSGKVVELLEDDVYRTTDLEEAASILRQAINVNSARA